VGKLYGLDTKGEVDWLKEDVPWEVYFDNSKHDPKVSWKVEHCRIPKLKELFAFLLPIFYPIKPHRITKGFATTLIWAWKYNRKINWSAIFIKNLKKIVSTLNPDKVTYLCPFVAHAYNQESVFTAEEESAYDKAEASWRFQLDIKKEEAEKIEESDGSDSISLNPPKPQAPGLSGLKARQPRKASRGEQSTGTKSK
jgi:hypothetical protein